MMRINGMRIHISEPVRTTVKVKRTWWARFCSQPFRKYDQAYQLEDLIKFGDIIQDSNGLHMSAETWADFKRRTSL